MPAEKQALSLYQGRVEIDFYPNSHQYRIRGDRSQLISVTSATGILDKSIGLIYWATGLARDHLINLIEQGGTVTRESVLEACQLHAGRKEEAAGIGTMVHDYAEAFARARIAGEELPEIPDDLPTEAIQGISAFLAWINQHHVRFISAERFVYSLAHGFVGKCDAVAVVDGKLSVVDYKTAKGIYTEHMFQVAGYDIAISEEDGSAFDQHVILKFGKESGEFEALVIDGDDMEENRGGFLHCLALKRRAKALDKR